MYSLFIDSEGKKVLSSRYDKPGLRYGDLKKELFEIVMDYFLPFRKKRDKLISRKDYVYDILDSGAKKANLIATEVLNRVLESVGVLYK